MGWNRNQEAAAKAAPAVVEPVEQPVVEPVVEPVVDVVEAPAAPESARAKSAREHAASRRADYVRALNEEREMCERAAKADRVAAIDAELERVSSVDSRTAPSGDEA